MSIKNIILTEVQDIKRKLLLGNLILSLVLFSLESFATGQIPDLLIYNSDTVSIFSNPLEQLPNIDSLRKTLFNDNKNHLTTACWREYQAEWTIYDNQLYLTAIYSCRFHEDDIQADLKQLFGDRCKNGKVKADWVTANILSPQGKLLYYVHSDYESLYEKEVIFEILRGQLIDTKTYDNSKSKKSKYSEDSNLIQFIYKNIQWENLPLQNKPVKVFVKFSANEQGIIDSVKVLTKENESFDDEAIRVVKSIPEWDIFYRHGQFERRPWNLPIVFSEENKLKSKTR